MGVEVRGARREEAKAVRDLISLAFDAESYGPSLEEPAQDIGSSSMDLDHRAENTRVLLVDGRIVSVVHLLRRQAYVHGNHAAMGWISMVATHPDYRGQGHMRHLMMATHSFMRECGLCFCGLMGAQACYSGSLGWRSCGDKLPALPRKYISPATRATDNEIRARTVMDEDIPFLSQLYTALNTPRFGPVIRSDEYWRRWSLRRPWQGIYVVACGAAGPLGYFHISGSTVDEIGWDHSGRDTQQGTLLAAASWAAEHGHQHVYFYEGAMGEAEDQAICHTLPGTRCAYANPLGQTVWDPDPTPYKLENWPEATGYLVKFVGPGPGVLSETDCTESLVEVLAQHSWYFYDGDSS